LATASSGGFVKKYSNCPIFQDVVLKLPFLFRVFLEKYEISRRLPPNNNPFLKTASN
jgi:hypothetical protein